MMRMAMVLSSAMRASLTWRIRLPLISLTTVMVSDIVVLTRKHNIKSKSGPHGGIEIDRDLKTDEVPYLTDFETSWLKRKYDEAEIEEDRIAAHSILRRFSL